MPVLSWSKNTHLDKHSFEEGEGSLQSLCSLPLTAENFFILHIKQTDVGLNKNTYTASVHLAPCTVCPSNHRKTQMWLLSGKQWVTATRIFLRLYVLKKDVEFPVDPVY